MSDLNAFLPADVAQQLSNMDRAVAAVEPATAAVPVITREQQIQIVKNVAALEEEWTKKGLPDDTEGMELRDALGHVALALAARSSPEVVLGYITAALEMAAGVALRSPGSDDRYAKAWASGVAAATAEVATATSGGEEDEDVEIEEGEEEGEGVEGEKDPG